MPQQKPKPNHPVYLVFIAAFLFVSLVPLAGLAVAPPEQVSSQGTEATWPEPMAGGAPNLDYLSQAGAWFEQHFAYRNEAIDADAHLRALVGTSNTRQVTLGTQGWLYYAGTLPDYLGTAEYTERDLLNIARNIAQMRSYAEARGAKFALLIAPNKNSVVPQYMPARLLAAQGPHALERLAPYLEAEGVTSVDLALALSDGGPDAAASRFFLLDSHWNDEGAAVAADALLAALGRAPQRAGSWQPAVHLGDIEDMLYPASAKGEQYQAYSSENAFAFKSEATDPTASWLVTQSDAGAGSLLMYRDSFANNLIEPLSAEFAQAVYTKLVPYDLTLVDSCAPDAVVVERAERHLMSFTSEPPAVPAPEVALASEPASALEAGTLAVEENGAYLVFAGTADPSAVDQSTYFYLRVVEAQGAQTAYEMLQVSAASADGPHSDFGYRAYLPAERFAPGSSASVIAERDGGYVTIATIAS